MYLIRTILQYVFIAAIIGVLWAILTAQLSVEGWAIGAGLGFAMLVAVRGRQGIDVRPLDLPQRVAWLIVYLIVLERDVIVASIDVALRILGVRKVDSGIIRVAVGDERQEVAALTAHGITITPGQLVVDFDHIEDERYVYVHCLSVTDSEGTVEQDQVRRMRFFKRILGNG
ncbi:MAG: Na+/H+ antiporter subunit E [Chloroflexi bacterium]|nr:Na+/H+ antiporter subunit E [Chloroflexota bacterium]